MTIGKRLREIRRAAGLTLAEVSARAGVGISTLSDFERGLTIPDKTLPDVARGYGLTVAELVDLAKEPAGEIADSPAGNF